jgi:hypothetical protein
MGTCAILGQAAGTAAALSIRHRCDPRNLSSGERLRQLQQTLMEDDCWLPGFTRPVSPLSLAAQLQGAGESLETLRDGMDRDRPGKKHAWEGQAGDAIEFHWNGQKSAAGMRLVFDSNLQLHKRMPCAYPHRNPESAIPKTLVKAFRLEAKDAGGKWKTVYRTALNYQRLVQVPLALETEALRFIPEETWGAETARVFSCEPLETLVSKIPDYPRGLTFSERRAEMNPQDLLPPESSGPGGKSKRSAA